MPSDAFRLSTLVETARSELTRAHRAAVNMDAAEMRRGLELAHTALRDAEMHEFAAKVASALEQLEAGTLAEMERLIETVRTDLDR